MLLLLVEDEQHIRAGIAEMLSGEGYQVMQAESLQQALQLTVDELPDLILSDINLLDGDGFTLLNYCKEQQLDVPIIFMTAFGNRDLAVRSMQQGAYDYVSKPLRFDELFAKLYRLKEMQQLRGQVHRKVAKKLEESQLALLGESAAMCQVRKIAEKAMLSNAPVLITGETGVGKGLLAKLIHSGGRSGTRPFVSINCASIPENLLESELFGYRKGAFSGADRNKKGLLEEADGTLFLDEIGDMPLLLQAKLLHVLDNKMFRPLGSTKDRRFVGRVIAATNVAPESLISSKSFRSDLYYRLSVITIDIPPLRQRIEDIVPLAERIYETLEREMGRAAQPLSMAQLLTLQREEWRGNVRQLRNHLERMLILDGDCCDGVGVEYTTLAEATMQFERDWIKRTVVACGGDKSAAAERLGVGLSTLYRKLES
ncbi:MAG: sigma-54 dependent transcriptional regulator [Mariprofundales bacterium]|nr:sigma-54 dependent transcriptional regulator [Mariprofundales bacterium]